ARLMEPLGRRPAELHVALARPSGDPAFEPEPFTDADMSALRTKLQREAAETVELIRGCIGSPTDTMRPAAQRLVAGADVLRARIDALVPASVAATKTRYHGDFHL